MSLDKIMQKRREARELAKRIKKCRNYKRRLEKFDAEKFQEKIEYYNLYIKACEEKIRENKKDIGMLSAPVKINLYSILAIIIILTGFMLLRPAFVGYVTLTEENTYTEYVVFTANDSSLTTESSNITLTVNDVGEPGGISPVTEEGVPIEEKVEEKLPREGVSRILPEEKLSPKTPFVEEAIKPEIPEKIFEKEKLSVGLEKVIAGISLMILITLFGLLFVRRNIKKEVYYFEYLIEKTLGYLKKRRYKKAAHSYKKLKLVYTSLVKSSRISENGKEILYENIKKLQKEFSRVKIKKKVARKGVEKHKRKLFLNILAIIMVVSVIALFGILLNQNINKGIFIEKITPVEKSIESEQYLEEIERLARPELVINLRTVLMALTIIFFVSYLKIRKMVIKDIKSKVYEFDDLLGRIDLYLRRKDFINAFRQYKRLKRLYSLLLKSKELNISAKRLLYRKVKTVEYRLKYTKRLVKK